MNRHFDDAKYYMKRAVTNVKRGMMTELEPAVEWVRVKTGRETEPEPTRVEMVRSEFREFRDSFEDVAWETLEQARGRLRSFRGGTN